MDLRTRVGKVEVEECHEVGRSPAGMIVIGSLTLEAREGLSL